MARGFDALEQMSVRDLLTLHVGIHDTLRSREVLRSQNAPAGDLAEWLFCRAMGWERQPASFKGYDAVAPDGTRYEIKAVRAAHGRKNRQVSALRGLEHGRFDMLAGIVFGHDYSVEKAALVPLDVVRARAIRSGHTNGWNFHLKDDLWGVDGVVDVTGALRAAFG